MEKGGQIIHMLGRLEIWWLNIYSEPKRRRTINIPINIKCLFNLHIDAVAGRVKVEHYRLLLKSKALMSLVYDRVDVFVDRLLYV